jgi:hypothetical protein
MSRKSRLGWGLKIFAMIVLFTAAMGAVVMWLWNWLAPDLFGWHPIGFGQAIGLLVLCRLLVGGFRGRAGGHWRGRLAERLEAMTPEEREKFRAGLRGRCGWHAPADDEAKRHGAET